MQDGRHTNPSIACLSFLNNPLSVLDLERTQVCHHHFLSLQQCSKRFVQSTILQSMQLYSAF